MKERSLLTQEISLDELDSVMLTFSFQSPPKELETFWIDLYDTDGGLPDVSIETVEKALENFLIPEMNARYDFETVKKLEVEVLSQATVTSSRRKWRRSLQSIGSEIETKVTVTFRNEPSPDTSEVQNTMISAMEDLSFFIGNLTDLAEGDEELANINRAERKERGGFGPGDDFFVAPIVEPIVDDTERIDFAVLMTVVAGGFLVLASLALYGIRKLNNSKEVDDGRPGLGQVNVFLGDGDESDIFSFEAALAESPAVSRMSASAYSTSQQSSDESASSDIFSGIDNQLTSPSEHRSVFSFLSGHKSEASSTTVLVSNKEKDLGKYKSSLLDSTPESTTPKPRLASLLTFSEDEEGSEEETENVKLITGMVLKPTRKKQPTEKKSTGRPSELKSPETTKVVGVAKVKFSPRAQFLTADGIASTSHLGGSTSFSANDEDSLSASSGFLASQKKSRKRGTSDAVAPPAESFMPSWGVLDYSSEKQMTPPKKLKQIPLEVADESIETTLQVHNVSSPKTKPQVLSPRVFSPSVLSDDGEESDPEVNLQWNNKGKSSTNAKKAKAFVRGIKKTPTTPSSAESQSTGGSPGFSPGRRRGQKGRRHAKSTAADGSQDYQAETMQQKDESLASFDAVSLSESEPSLEKTPKTPGSANKSFFSLSSSGSEGSNSVGSTSKRLINDLVWLEKKIAGASGSQNPDPGDTSESEAGTPVNRKLNRLDSLSFASNDVGEEGSVNSPESTNQQDYGRTQGVSAIVCRDCFAPPGKLRIVIHSTKDGPAIHTVKDGSSLRGHVFPGDLIISVDDVDTRAYTAEQVMKMMTARNKYQRKITVLHFEKE
jgi:hypothetical protein